MFFYFSLQTVISEPNEVAVFDPDMDSCDIKRTTVSIHIVVVERTLTNALLNISTITVASTDRNTIGESVE